MTEPERQADQIPPGNQKHECGQEITSTSEPNASTQACESNKNEEESKEIDNKGKFLSQLWVYIWETRVGKYLSDLFFKDKGVAFWMLVFTIVLAIYTAKLFHVANSTDETMRIAQRPWIEGREDPLVCLNNVIEQDKRLKLFLNDAPNIGIGGACPYRGPIFAGAKPVDKFVWWVHVANTGQTPAIGTSLKAARCISKAPDNTPPSLSDCFNETKDGDFVSPRTVYPHDGEVTKERKFSLTTEEIADINRESKFLYILARTEYSELDGTPHFKNFCWRYNPYQIYSLRYCEGGNDDDTGKGQ